MDGMLSQEEINALLSGISSDLGVQNEPEEQLTEAEKDAIGEISNISMGTAATTLFSLVNQRVNITAPVVRYATWNDIVKEFDKPCVFIQIYYDDGLDGNNILILKENDVKIITDLMMGGDGANLEGELSELHLSAISEAMNQMMGSAATSISSMLEKRVSISPPTASTIDLDQQMNGENIADFLKGQFVRVSFNMQIGNLVDSELMQLYPFEFARDLYKQFMQAVTETDVQINSMEDKQPIRENKAGQQEVQGSMSGQMMGTMPGQMPGPATGQQGISPYAIPYPGQGIPQQGAVPYVTMPVQDVNVAPVQFAPLSPSFMGAIQPENIDLLMDVPLEVTVELGRTSKSIKEILDFAPGTIIELNRLAGEPIDVLVNGKYVAKGEVVVMEEAFGIRVTEIIKQNNK